MRIKQRKQWAWGHMTQAWVLITSRTIRIAFRKAQLLLLSVLSAVRGNNDTCRLYCSEELKLWVLSLLAKTCHYQELLQMTEERFLASSQREVSCLQQGFFLTCSVVEFRQWWSCMLQTHCHFLCLPRMAGDSSSFAEGMIQCRSSCAHNFSMTSTWISMSSLLFSCYHATSWPMQLKKHLLRTGRKSEIFMT